MATTKTKKPKEQTAADIPSGKGSDLRDQPETNAWGRAAERGFKNGLGDIGKQVKEKLNASRYNNLQGKIPDLRKYAGMNPGEQRNYHKDAKKAQREGTKKAAKTGAQFAKRAAMEYAKKNPYIRAALEVWKHRKLLAYVICGSSAAVFLIIMLILNDSGGAAAVQAAQQQQQQAKQVTSDISCLPDKLVNVGETSTCTIHVSYSGSADNIVILDTIDQTSAFVSATLNGTFDPYAKTVTWDAKKLNLPLSPINITVSVVIKSIKADSFVYNTYAISPTNLSNSLASSSAQANQNTCNGSYNFNITTPPNTLGNFGDPFCDSSKQLIGQQLNQLDQTNGTTDAYKWGLLIQCESSYNPNAYNPKSTSGYGAYGLFQMNPTGKGNPTADDNGSVIWSQQIINATNLLKDLKAINKNGSNYWACAPAGL